MAFVTNFICSFCNQEKYEVITPDRICATCWKKFESERRANHFSELNNMTLEERVQKIERELYDLDLNKTLKSLKSRLAVY